MTTRDAKKLVAGVGVLGIFVAYSAGIRHQLPSIAKPASLKGGAAGNSSPATNQAANASPGGPTTTTPKYKDGTYTGSVADAFYGNIQVAVTIRGGKITDVKFLQYPDTHETSVYINQQAIPYLQQEAIQAQNSNVNIISGATFTSQAFQQSLAAALSQA